MSSTDQNSTLLPTYIVYFCIGILACQKVNLFGEIYIGELFCAAVILFNLRKIYFPSWLKGIFFTACCWLVAQFISDLINQTEVIKAVKGILVPVFIILIIVGHQTFFANRLKFLPIYLFGLFIGIAVNRSISGGGAFIDNPWKWGLGLSTALFFFTWIEFYCHRFKNTILLIASGLFLIISIAHSARSLAFLIVIACLVPIFAERITNSSIYKQFTTAKHGALFFCFMLFALVFLLDRSFAFLFTFEPFLDLLPPEDAIKYSVQASNEWGIIIGGRSELLISLQAFIDKPFIGHGSWAQDPFYVYSRLDMLDASNSLLYSDLATAELNLKSFLIPTHSYLMGSLVWGGLFAGLFWLNIYRTTLLGFLKSYVISSPLLVYISLGLLWNILFSPFGADARWISTVLLWVYLMLTHHISNSTTN